jgi:hypothetical protein
MRPWAMFNDTPWQDLGVEGVDSRRVDHAGKWNFFWVMMPNADPALALILDRPVVPAPTLPRLGSLETGFATVNGSTTFYLRLKDHAQIELFETLCRDVASSAEQAMTEPDALIRAIGRTNRWYHLLRGGRENGLSEEKQKGLIGELAVLEWLSRLIGPRAAITAWTGPSGSPKDFELYGHCIEIKARRAAAQPYVQISNEFQLADVDDHQLWLSVIAVDKVTEPFGDSLDHFVLGAASHFQGENPNIQMLWEAAISATGYRIEDDYTDIRWVASNPSWYAVSDGFPRVDLPLREGVRSLKYAIALAACAPFEIGETDLMAAVSLDYEVG